MASDVKNLISGAATVSLGGTDIASVDEKGIELEVEKTEEELGDNLSFRGPLNVIEKIKSMTVSFASEESNVKKMAQALLTGATAGLGTYEENATTPNYFKLNMDSFVPTAAALVIATVGPEYVAGTASTRTITFSRVVADKQTWKMVFGFGIKQVVPFKFKVLQAASGYDLDCEETWT